MPETFRDSRPPVDFTIDELATLDRRLRLVGLPAVADEICRPGVLQQRGPGVTGQLRRLLDIDDADLLDPQTAARTLSEIGLAPMSAATVPAAEVIGTVELLQMRVCPLDTNAANYPTATEIVVPPGTYPVYRDGDVVFWMLTGQRNARGGRQFGDGLIAIGGPDEGYGPPVTFPSQSYGPEQFAEFRREPMCTEGHPAQRLRFTIPAESLAR